MVPMRRFHRILVLFAALTLFFVHDSFLHDSSLANAQGTPSLLYMPLVTGAAAPPTNGPIAIENATMQFYTVQGISEDEIRGDINAKRPGNYDALTEWNFQWQVPGDGNGSCNLDGVTIDYTIKVIFPQWTPPAEASSEVIQKWNNYINALALHESGHVERVVPFVPDLINTIKASSCDSYNAAAQGWLDTISQQNDQYDTDTDHGATQGAVFP